MLENLFTNVFGRPKNKSSSGRNSQSDSTGTSTGQPGANSGPMTGPFSMSSSQMPQPPSLPYPVAPYPAGGAPAQPMTAYYPSLPFSQPPAMPTPYAAGQGPAAQPYKYPTGTISNHVSPLESVPFEAKLTLNNSANLVNLDQLFREIKKAGEVVDRADAYLRSNQSDYDFKTEQGLIYQ